MLILYNMNVKLVIIIRLFFTFVGCAWPVFVYYDSQYKWFYTGKTLSTYVIIFKRVVIQLLLSYKVHRITFLKGQSPCKKEKIWLYG